MTLCGGVDEEMFQELDHRQKPLLVSAEGQHCISSFQKSSSCPILINIFPFFWSSVSSADQIAYCEFRIRNSLEYRPKENIDMNDTPTGAEMKRDRIWWEGMGVTVASEKNAGVRRFFGTRFISSLRSSFSLILLPDCFKRLTKWRKKRPTTSAIGMPRSPALMRILKLVGARMNLTAGAGETTMVNADNVEF